MSRVAVQLLRDENAKWKPVGVWFSTPQALQSRLLPGVGLEDFFRRVHEGAYRPTLDDGTQGTWDDWIDYAMDALSNGHDLHIVEVDPVLTVDIAYATYVLALDEEGVKRYKPKGVPNISTVPIGDLTGPAARA